MKRDALPSAIKHVGYIRAYADGLQANGRRKLYGFLPDMASSLYTVERTEAQFRLKHKIMITMCPSKSESTVQYLPPISGEIESHTIAF